jgi:hypothetical protein
MLTDQISQNASTGLSTSVDLILAVMIPTVQVVLDMKRAGNA